MHKFVVGPGAEVRFALELQAQEWEAKYHQAQEWEDKYQQLHDRHTVAKAEFDKLKSISKERKKNLGVLQEERQVLQLQLDRLREHQGDVDPVLVEAQVCVCVD